MNCRIYLALLLFVSSCSFAQTNAPQHAWNVTLKVVDESNQPVIGANVSVAYFVYSHPANLSGLSDADGIFTATHSAISDLNELGFTAEKTGYYSTIMSHMLYPPYDPAKWNINQTLILKKIGKPIAMYAKSVNLGMPVFDKPAGFDLMIGDWVAPYGKGINADIIFEAHLQQRAENNADFKLTVSFPKPGDGIQDFAISEMDKSSGLLSAHEAPAVGYLPQWIQIRSRKPGQTETGNFDRHRNYFFRVHTKLDENGNVVSTRYGKIYGDFMQFTYYLNPTINDRNIEFDPKQNLIGGLKAFEQVDAP